MPFVPRLVLGVIVLNVVVWLFALLSIQSSYENHTARARSGTENLSLVLERDISGTFAQVDLSLEHLTQDYAELRESNHFDDKAWDKNLKRERSLLPVLSGLRGVDANGKVLYGMSPGEPVGVDVSDREYFAAHRTQPGSTLHFSQPVMARVSKTWSIIISRRLQAANGAFEGIVAASIPLDWFQERFSSLKLGKNGSIGFRDLDLRLIARAPRLEGGQIGSTKIADDFRAALRANPYRGSYLAGATSIDGVRRMHNYRRLERYPFYINVGMAEDDYLSEWRNEMHKIFGLSCLFMAMSVVFAWVLRHAWLRQHWAAQRLQSSEKDFRSLAQAVPFGIILLNHDGALGYMNPAVTRILGYTQEDIPDVERWWQQAYPDEKYRREVMQAWQDLVLQPSRPESMERVFWVTRRDGVQREIRFLVEPLEDRRFAVTLEDITERHAAEQAIRNLAFFDPLTGLPNRRQLFDRLQQTVRDSKHTGIYHALLFLDLDRFKNLNDSKGHDVGDRLLIETAQRLRSCIRAGDTDTVSRLGGDEFVVLLEHMGANAEEAKISAQLFAENVITRLSETYRLDNEIYQGTASIGIRLFTGGNISVEEVFKHADLAMYQAKASGRNAIRFFDPQMQADVSARLALEHALHQAISEQEFVLYYQPQVDATHGVCIGVEALIRWQSPSRGMVSPLEFIPIAEETGLILPIGNWVLAQACKRLQEWREEPAMQHLSIAVNVSARQFHQADFVMRVHQLIELHRVPAGRLKLEITESMLVEDVEGIIDTMSRLRAFGVLFSLDDFGTGYSSLSYLKRLPLDQLKIDKSFVRDITVDPNDAAICRAITVLGRSLGLSIVAEGVENTEQWDFLKAESCGFAQGYLFARPMPKDMLLDWMRQQTP